MTHNPFDAVPDTEKLPADRSALLARFRAPSLGRAIWQLVNTLLPYLALWVVMAWVSSRVWWLVLPISVFAAGFLVRLFILFHDCGHGSFFASRRANAIIGFIAGVLTFAPSHHWWGQHARHHASSGNLDRRGTGDIWTLTVREYLEASRWKKFAYRLARNPFVLLVLAPFFVFVVQHRFPDSDATLKERRSVWWTNAAIACVAVAASLVMGFREYLLIQSLILAIAGAAGVWLFYVQHQFDGVYWERHERWDYSKAALQGSSYYRLPKILQWFTGNIGFHHIHHLSPGVPNYHLDELHRAHPDFQRAKPLTLLSSLKSLHLRLWDEADNRLVGYPSRAQRPQNAKRTPSR